MTDFRPFQAWRYDPEKLDMNKAIAPPYDVISSEEQKRLYERAPYNCIRLILNQIETSDTETHNRYTRAKGFYEQWRHEKWIVQEAEPSFYLYRQIFPDPRTGKSTERNALLGRLRLEPFEKGVVVPHEKTLSKPRADRRKLLEATQTNFSPVFGLYEDPKGDVSSLRFEITKTPPLFEAVDDQKVQHAVWVVNRPEWVERIHEGMASRKIYIADGHHRYQTALEYGLEKRRKEGLPAGQAGDPEGDKPYDFVLMALVEFNDPGLILLPTHRVILPYLGFETSAALQVLEPYFILEAMPFEKLEGELARNEAASPPSFGLLMEKGQSYRLTLRDLGQAKKLMIPGKPDVWYPLDVNILAHLVFKLWKIDEMMWESVLRFTHHSEEAAAQVREGRAKAAFFLKAPSVSVLRDMGEVRELMPQKSTYFHPKLASGLVFYSHS